MPQGLTLEQLKAMGATPVQKSPAAGNAPSGKKGLTLDELQKMGAQPVGKTGQTPPPAPAVPAAPQKPLLERIGDFTKGEGIGFAKGIGSTAAGASALGEKVMKAPLQALGLPTIQQKPLGQQVEESGVLQSKNTAEKVGKFAEQVAELLVPIGGEAKAVAKATEIPRAERGLAKAGELMYEVLRPSKGEVAKYEIKRGRDLKEIAGAIAQQGIKPTIENGVMNWKAGIEKMRGVVADAGTRLQQILERQKGRVDLAKVAQETNKNLEKMFKNASELEAAKAHAQELLMSEAQRFGDVVVPKAVANQIKQGMWQVGYDAMKPLKSRVARQVGHAISDAISEGAPKAVKDLNKNMSLAIDAMDVMEKATGRVIKGGRLGRYFGGLVGSMALGGVPVIGAPIGYEVGQAVSKGLAERAATKGAEKAAKLMQKAAKAGLKLPMVR